MDWLQLALLLGLLALCAKPLGHYISEVLKVDGKTFLDPVLRRLEHLIYKIIGVDPKHEQGWKAYTFSLLAFNLIGVLLTYLLLRFQHFLPLNPQELPGVPDHTAFNAAISFVTHTNWQSYVGEQTLSYFSQMVALTTQMFIAPAVALAVAAALVRGIARHSVDTVGNFWTTAIRSILYLLLPLSLFFALVFVWEGAPQNFKAYEETPSQLIVQGPIASQVAPKILGSNGGGFTSANSAHPYENPTPLSNFLQVFSMLLIPSSLTYTLGRRVKNQKHGWAIWTAMVFLFLVGLFVVWYAESTAMNMEGKEVRFGIFGSALFATATTGTSCGAVNCMHDSFTPLGGLVLLTNLLLGCLNFGGVGAGLFTMLIFAILAAFFGGLMIGRTPDYLGKKIEAYDVKACVLFIVTAAFNILGWTAWASLSSWGVAGLGNSGPHGFSEILYAYAEATTNNGSAFAGLDASSTWYDTTIGLAMLIGRYIMIIPVMALAGSMAKKKSARLRGGTLPLNSPLFITLLVSTIFLLGMLTFFPALSLGPILEYYLTRQP